jgi:hypothetical protein
VSRTKLEDLLTEVESLDYAGLKARYQELLRRPSPPRLSLDLLRRALAYQLQADWLGGLAPKVEKLLQSSSSPRNLNRHRRLDPGSQLVREWQGGMHVVDVIEGGYRWQGQRYASLSAVAREITGTRWSGPRFFGLAENGKR